MTLPEMTADELAEIDRLGFAFEQKLYTLLERAEEPVSVESTEVLALRQRFIDQYAGPHGDAFGEELVAVATEVCAHRKSDRLTASRISGFVSSDSSSADDGEGDANASDLRSVVVGTQIGPYIIDEQIGRGGMGEVFRGRDTRLDREVAIKILVQEIRSDSDPHRRYDRFHRETRAVAGLSHPSIVSLYDVGQHQGRPFAVMELLRGMTLRERMRQAGRLSPDEVRFIGAHAADALATAHQAGVIHRDLKPENLFLTEDGRVKLLDFGLSRFHGGDPQSDGETASGVIMGTMGYLSPEQANGKKVTAAADIFSLGCVLHECLYGKRPFAGETVAESLAAIINSEPEIDEAVGEEAVSDDRELVQLIRSCLAKDPAQRISDAHDLAKRLQRGSELALEATDSGENEANFGGDYVRVRHSTGNTTRTTADQGDANTTVNRPHIHAANLGPPVEDPRTDATRWLDPPAPALWRGIVAVAAAMVVAVAFWLGWMVMNRPPQIRSVAVLPLESSDVNGPVAGEQEGSESGLRLGKLAKGEELSAAIANQMNRISDLQILPYLPLRTRDRLALDYPDVESSQNVVDRVKEIGSQLGVDAVLVGSVATDADGFDTINVQLLSSESGFQVGKYQARVAAAENLIGQEEIAKQIADAIGRELEVYHSGRERSNDSYHCLVNGHARMDPDSVDALSDALACYQSAVQRDEKFPEAYAGIAMTAMLLLDRAEPSQRDALIKTAREAIARVEQLEPNQELARFAEAMLAWQVDLDFEKAERLFERYYPDMQTSWVANYAYGQFLVATGRYNRALQAFKQAERLDPMSLSFKLESARTHWLRGEHESALNQIANVKTAFADADLSRAIGLELDVLESLGRIEDASRLLTSVTGKKTSRDYWTSRQASLRDFPYGPYGEDLNEAIWKLRRLEMMGLPFDAEFDGFLVRLSTLRASKLPYLVSSHPAFAGVRYHSALRDFAATLTVPL